MNHALNRKNLLPLQIGVILLGACASLTTLNTYAQDGKKSGLSSVLLEELVVTARKTEELASEIPIALTAYGADQLDALKVRDLTDLSVGIPNVALDDVGTTRGTANFSIRGLGINSSIPSIDPTVGIFVDGVYMGVNGGIIFDTFDMQSIEVLRGPQGIAFGRNVTGGAIQLTTKLPGQEFQASAKVAVEGGGEELNKYIMASVGGPLSDSVSAKISVYSNRDDGWFKNEATGDAFGEVETDMIRPVVTWAITDDATLIVRYEHTETESDGPASQNHTNGSGVSSAVTWDRDSHKFSIDEEGFVDLEADFVSIQYDQYVGFGDGTITNIFGWRDFEQTALIDVDATPSSLFHSTSTSLAEQYSNELRYNGSFDKLTLTTGLYYFKNEINYDEVRLLLGELLGPGAGPFATQPGGGNYDVESIGIFVSTDYDINHNLTLSAGVRFTQEEKKAQVYNLNVNASQFPAITICSAIEQTCIDAFEDEKTWTNVSPKLGFSYAMDDLDANVYGHWTRGIRSGGYNLRDTANDGTPPGPFDEETVDSFEVGYKMTVGQRGRFNAAMFYTAVDDMQREINESSAVSGVTQTIQNTADATLMGIELDATYALSEEFLVTASVGYVDSEYDSVDFDLNGDGVVDGVDEGLDIPRAAELTYSLGINHSTPLADWGHLSSRISYAYRDDSAYTDSNLGYIDEQKILDVGVDLHYGENFIVGLYGKNLTDEVKHGGDTQLPDALGPQALGGSFAPLSKGRVYGLELIYNY